jgi:hypothetical protein
MPVLINWRNLALAIEAEDRELSHYKISKIIRHSSKPKSKRNRGNK